MDSISHVPCGSLCLGNASTVKYCESQLILGTALVTLHTERVTLVLGNTSTVMYDESTHPFLETTLVTRCASHLVLGTVMVMYLGQPIQIHAISLHNQPVRLPAHLKVTEALNKILADEQASSSIIFWRSSLETANLVCITSLSLPYPVTTTGGSPRRDSSSGRGPC